MSQEPSESSQNTPQITSNRTSHSARSMFIPYLHWVCTKSTLMEERESIETTRWIRVEVRCGCYFSLAETLIALAQDAAALFAGRDQATLAVAPSC
jgi:hypothetical protein